ncbi:unnamed protein product [Arctia plantaginis]|uniref:Uncharacterized protein n=1 Tax=Arctia plantaginis TaxID=874455 RepID=A0A8S1A210_ARCPL|nr:unnamed protein product [Arctia plantaginis]CAB3239350.1 unnamed protein product [Arctia plantaginis]
MKSGNGASAEGGGGAYGGGGGRVRARGRRCRGRGACGRRRRLRRTQRGAARRGGGERSGAALHASSRLALPPQARVRHRASPLASRASCGSSPRTGPAHSACFDWSGGSHLTGQH